MNLEYLLKNNSTGVSSWVNSWNLGIERQYLTSRWLMAAELIAYDLTYTPPGQVGELLKITSDCLRLSYWTQNTEKAKRPKHQQSRRDWQAKIPWQNEKRLIRELSQEKLATFEHLSEIPVSRSWREACLARIPLWFFVRKCQRQSCRWE